MMIVWSRSGELQSVEGIEGWLLTRSALCRTAETLKYFYLIFSEPDLISLDDYVL